MFCKHCGAELEKDAAFCVRCGIPIDDLTAEDATPSSANPSRKSVKPQTHAQIDKKLPKWADKKLIAGAIAAVAIILVIVVGIFAVQRANSVQGTWYTYSDAGEYYEITFDGGGAGTCLGNEISWTETDDTVTIDYYFYDEKVPRVEETWTKEQGTLKDDYSDLTFFKSSEAAEKDYDERISTFREEFNKYVSSAKEQLEGTWEYESDDWQAVLNVHGDGTWEAESSYDGQDSYQCEGTWEIIDELGDEQLYNYAKIDSATFNGIEAEYPGGPIYSLYASLTQNDDGTATVALGNGWTKQENE